MKKKFVTIALLGTMTFGSLILPTQVSAAQYNQQIESAEKEAEKNQQLIDEKTNRLNQIQSEVSTTAEELKAITATITNNEEKTAALAKDMETAQKEMQALIAEIDELKEKIAQRTEKLEDQARTVQTSGFSQNYIDFILESESLSDVIGRVDVVTDLVTANKTLVQEQVNDQKAVEEKSAQTEQKINQQNAIAMELEQTRTEMEKQLLDKEVIVAQLAIEQASTEEELVAFAAQKEAAQAQVVQFTSAQSEAEAQLLREEEARLAKVEEEAEGQLQAETEVVAATEEPTPTETVEQTENSTPAQSNAPEAPSESTAEVNTQTQPSTNTQSTNQSNQEAEKRARQDREKAEREAAEKARKAADKKKAEQQQSKPSVSGGSVLQIASSLTGQGIPYHYGGTTLSGFDCSGFTQYVFAKAGKSLPRTAYQQYASSAKVSSPQAGDLVFFSNNGSPSGIFHVGIYTGGGNMYGSQSSTGPASVNYSSNVYWSNFATYYGRY